MAPVGHNCAAQAEESTSRMVYATVEEWSLSNW